MTITSVSTLSIARATQTSVRVSQTDLFKAQQEVSTGRKFDVSGDLGSRTGYLVGLRNAKSGVEEFLVQATFHENRLSVMQTALEAARKSVEPVRNLALGASGLSDLTTVNQITEAAESALKSFINALNVSEGDRFLFGGTRFDIKPLQALDEVGPSGLSPRQAVGAVTTNFGPIVTPADVDAYVTGPNGLASLFSNTFAPDPLANFDQSFFLGSTNQTQGSVGDLPVTYAATAGDAPVRQVLQGLHLLAEIGAADVGGDLETYRRVADYGWRLISEGVDGMIQTQARLGQEEAAIEQVSRRFDVQNTIFNNQIVDLERADEYESALRVTTLQNQLEATFSMTARISRLSLINFL